AVYDDRLRGEDGIQRLLVDKDSTVTGTLGTTPAVSGDNLVLSLDAGVQRLAESALAQGIAAADARTDRHRSRHFTASKGAAIVPINFTKTLIKSCDTVYYRLAYDQWLHDGGAKARKGAREVFPNMARSWGFGARTGIDLPDERQGLITDRAYKQRAWEQ